VQDSKIPFDLDRKLRFELPSAPGKPGSGVKFL